MAIILSTIQDRVEKTLYKLLEAVTAEVGYGLVKQLYNNDDTGIANYNSDLQDVITAKGFAIEIFGASAPYSKYAKQAPRIVIVPSSIQTGDVGNVPNPTYALQEGGGFIINKEAPMTSDLHYEIRSVGTAINQDRIMNSILGYTLGTRGYFQIYDTLEEFIPPEYFFMQRINNVNFPNQNFSIIERISLYEVKDVYEFANQEIGSASAISQIQLTTIVQNILQDIQVIDSTKVIT